MGRNIIELKNLTKRFGDVTVVNNINLTIKENEFVTLLGPSGCGKTTTLRMIGGFEEPDEGQIFFEGKLLNPIPAYKRNINTVFQRYALFTHMNVFENIAFGLRIKKIPKDEIEKRVKRMLKLVDLEGFEKRNVDSLSGGQQQRVAIARALVNEPKVLLLDEPLGALDLKLRKEMQIELLDMQRSIGITFIYVTHDQEEALTMSDTVVVMNNGVIQQVGTPQDIYNEPINRFVADFIGESNIIEAVMLEDYKVAFDDVVLDCVDKGFAKNEPVDIVIRPEDIRIVTNPDEGMIKGTVKSVIFKGVHYEMMIESDTGREYMVHRTIAFPVGSYVGMNVQPFDIQVMKRGDPL
ncbi:MAG TPA: ABC transporter ATP-binding protein [Clostridiaceae bacterium]|nr:ABC transporter ATP-binding protein [Clostridiaceae bacterium]